MANESFAGGDGSVNNPYLIEDAHDLNAIRNNLTASYKLIKNIDLNISPYNEGSGWVPIGSSGTGNTFTGILDGNGHTIKNLYINRSANYQALFGYIYQSTIKSIRLENVNITGTGYTAGLVGNSTSYSIISNSCITRGNVIGTTYVGGLISANSTSTILNSYSNAKVTGSAYVGGLIGRNTSGTVSNCYSTGIVVGTSYYGGLVGYKSDSSVNNSYWDIDASGQTASVEGTGLTTVQMKDPLNFVNWNSQVLDDGTTKIWILKEGEYPKLYFEKLISFLIRQNNQYNSIKEEFYDEINDIYNSPVIPILDINNFNTYGIVKLSEIHNNAFNKIINDKFNIAILK